MIIEPSFRLAQPTGSSARSFAILSSLPSCQVMNRTEVPSDRYEETKEICQLRQNAAVKYALTGHVQGPR